MLKEAKFNLMAFKVSKTDDDVLHSVSASLKIIVIDHELSLKGKTISLLAVPVRQFHGLVLNWLPELIFPSSIYLSIRPSCIR